MTYHTVENGALASGLLALQPVIKGIEGHTAECISSEMNKVLAALARRVVDADAVDRTRQVQRPTKRQRRVSNSKSIHRSSSINIDDDDDDDDADDDDDEGDEDVVDDDDDDDDDDDATATATATATAAADDDDDDDDDDDGSDDFEDNAQDAALVRDDVQVDLGHRGSDDDAHQHRRRRQIDDLIAATKRRIVAVVTDGDFFRRPLRSAQIAFR